MLFDRLLGKKSSRRAARSHDRSRQLKLRRRLLVPEALEARALLAGVTYVDDTWTGTLIGVDPDGAGPATSFGTDAFATIQEGVDAVTAGGVVNVYEGTYTETVIIPKTLSLLGAQAGVDARTRIVPLAQETVLQGPTYLAGRQRAIQVSAGVSGVTIDGFYLQNSTQDPFGAATAIYLADGSAGTTVRNNIVTNNTTGLFLANNSAVQQTLIERNLFKDNTQSGSASGTSIYADNFTAGTNLQNVLIRDNAFTNSSLVVDSWAVGLSNVGASAWSNITFQGNTVTNHGRGLYGFGVANASITQNTFTGASNYAVGLFDGVSTAANSNWSITNNQFTNNFRGIWVDDFSGISAHVGTLSPSGNTFTGGTYYIVNSNTVAGVSSDVVATGNTYDGVVLDGSTTVAQIYDIADKMLDAVDVGTYGRIDLRAGRQFVTPGSFLAPTTTQPSVQRAINAADNGDVVHIESGAYFGGANALSKTVELSAGASPGQVTINGDLLLDSGDELVIEIVGTNPATQYDNFIVNGTVDVSGATLTVTSSYTPVAGNVFTLVANDGSDVSGAFAGLTAGSLVDVNGTDMKIFYTGNDGNDIVLVQQTPTVVYVEDSWNTFTLGDFIADADFGLSGNQSAIFGYNAFSTIAAAQAAVAAGGLIVVRAGSYGEAVVLTGTLSTRVTGATELGTGTVIVNSLAGTSSNPLALGVTGAAAGLNVGDATSTTFAGLISGPGSLTKVGAGTLTLSNSSSSYSGGTNINGGTLSINSIANNGTNSAAGVGNFTLAGGTLEYTGPTASTNRTFLLNAGGGTFRVDDGTGTVTNLSIGGVISGAGGLIKTGVDTLSLTSALNTYTGVTDIREGTLSAVDVSVASGASSLGNAASAILLGTNTTVGTLQYAGTGADTLSRPVTLGTLAGSATGNTIRVANNVTLTVSGAIGGAPVNAPANTALTIAGASLGQVTLSATNTFEGNIVVDTARLSVAGNNQLGNTDSNEFKTITVQNAGTFLLTTSFDPSVPGTAGSTTLTGAKRFIIGSGGGTIDVASGQTLTLNDASQFSGSGTLTKANAGTISLGFDYTGFTGNIVINAGVIAASGDLRLGAVPGAATPNKIVINGGVLQANGTYTLSANRGIQLGVSGGTGTGTIDVTTGNTLTYAGIIANVGADADNFTKAGGGTLILSTSHTYSGITQINAGVLEVTSLSNGGASSTLGASSSAPANLVFNGGVLRYNGSSTGTTNRNFTVTTSGGGIENNSAAVASVLNMTGSLSYSGSGSRNFILGGTNTGENTANFAIGNSGGATTLIKNGTGTWVLANATNSYTGITTVNAGLLIPASDDALGDAGSVLINALGSFGLRDNISIAKNLTIHGSGVNNQGAILNLEDSNALTGNVIVASNSLIGASAGTLTIGASSANTVTMGTNDLGFNSAAGASIVVSSVISSTAGTAQEGLFEGVLSGSFDESTANPSTAITLGTPAGQTWTTNGGDTYWQIVNRTWVYTGQVRDLDGIFAFAESFDDSVSVRIDGQLRLRNTSAGQASSTGSTTNNPNGGVTNFGLGAGNGWHTIEIRFGGGTGNNGATTGGSTGWSNTKGFGLRNSTTNLTSTNGGDYVIPLEISNGIPELFRTRGANEVIKSGAGTVTFASANTYTGPTTVNGGTLLVNGSITSNATVNAGAVLGGNGLITGNVTSTSTGTVNAGASPGLLTVTGNYSANSTFEINAPYTVAGVGGDYDRIVVNGILNNINLGAATVSFVSAGGGSVPVVPHYLTLIENNTGNAIVPFTNLTQGQTVTLGSGGNARTFIASYTGGDGNDLVLFNADAPTVVYVDDDFSGSYAQFMTDADLGTNLNQPALFGVSAFDNLADALAAVSSGGVIVVNDGVYSESITLAGTQTLRVTGPDVPQTVTIRALNTAIGQTLQLDGASELILGDVTNASAALAGTIVGSGDLTKVGAGTLTISGANSYSGLTTISAGVVNIQSGSALGSASFGTTVAAGAALELQGNIAVGAEALSLSGTGVSGNGALRNISDANTWGGLITLAATSEIQSDSGSLTIDVPAGDAINSNFTVTFDALGASTIEVADAITGSASITKAGNGTLTFSGTSANTYSGLTTINAGTLVLAKTAGVDAVGDDVVIGDGVGLDTLRLAAANQLPDTTDVTINAGGVFDLNSFSDAIDSLLGTGTVTSGVAGSATLTIGASGGGGTFGGVIQNGSGVVSLVKDGSGTITLTNNHTYTGTTSIDEGTLTVDGQIGAVTAAGTLSIANGATLSGSGTVTANISGASGSTILASGNLTLGRTDSTAGVSTAGALTVGTNTVTLRDADAAVLGGVTSISAGGSLVAANGIEVGGTLTTVGNGVANITGDVATISGASITPGGSGTGILNISGNLTLASGSTLQVHINGATAGTDYDQLGVTGLTTINSATLSAVGTGFTPAPGTVVTLINTAPAGSVTGTFSGYAEGSTLTVGAFSGVLTYAGGLNANDVTITVLGPVITTGTAGGDDFELRRRIDIGLGIDNIELLLGGIVIDARPYNTVTSWTIDGLGGDDTLLVNYGYTGGYFQKDVLFIGGADTNALTVQSGSFGAIVYDYTAGDDGTIKMYQDAAATTLLSTITYSEQATVVDTSAATNVTFNLRSTGDLALLEDAGSGQTRLRSTNVPVTFTSTTFVAPLAGGQVTINLGAGNDTLTIPTLNSPFAPSLVVNGDANTDSIVVDANLNIGGDIDFTSETIRFNNATNSSGGDITLDGNVVLGGASIVVALSTTASGSVEITGTVTSNVAAQTGLSISAGTGAVTLGSTVGTPANPLRSLTVNTAGQTTLGGDINTDTSAGGTGNVTFSGGTPILVDVSLTIDTEQGNNGAGGTVDFGTSVLSADAAGRSLTINTLPTGFAAGDVFNLETSAASGFALVNLTVDADDITADAVLTTGAIDLFARNAITLSGVMNATASTITIAANQDGVGSQGFAQSVGANIVTTNNTVSAVSIAVGGAGSANIQAISVGTGAGRVTFNVGNDVTDGNGAAVNITAYDLVANPAGGIDSDTQVSIFTANTTDVDGDVRIDEVDDITITAITTTGDNSDVRIFSTSGSIAQTGPIQQTGLSSNTNIQVLAADETITLTNSANQFAGEVTLQSSGSAGDVSITDSLGPLVLSVNSIGGDFTVLSTGGNIEQTLTTFVIGGESTFTTTTLNADILLATQPNNNFVGAVGVFTVGPTGDALLLDINSITLKDSTVGGSLTVTSGGGAGHNISQTVGSTVVVGGVSLFTAGVADVLLTSATNDFNSVGVASSTNTALTDANSLAINIINAATQTQLIAGAQGSGIGAITDNNGAGNINVFTSEAYFEAGTGIALETQLATLAAKNDVSGDIVIVNQNTMLLTIDTVAGIDGVRNTGSLGNVDITNDDGGITVSQSSEATVDFKLTTGETASTTAESIAIAAGVTIAAGSGDILLYAGDNFTVPATAVLTAGDLILLQSTNTDASAGSTFTFFGDVNGTLAEFRAAAGVNGADTFDMRPDTLGTLTPIFIYGEEPLLPPGDLLNLNIVGLGIPTLSILGPNDGEWSFFGAAGTVTYYSIETVNTVPASPYNLVLDMQQAGFQDGDFDLIEVQLVAAQTQLEIKVDGNQVFLGNDNPINSLTILGSTDDETLRIYADGDGYLPTEGGGFAGASPMPSRKGMSEAMDDSSRTPNIPTIYFDGDTGSGTDLLDLRLGAGRNVAYFSDVAPGFGANAGDISVTSATGPIRPGMFLTFSTVENLNLEVQNGDLRIDSTSTPDTTSLTIDDIGGSDGVSRLTGNNGVATTTFSGFNTLYVAGGTGNETITLNSIDGAGAYPLTSLTLDGSNTLRNDTGNDTLHLKSLPATVSASILGGFGNDTIFLYNDANTVDQIAGTVSINGENNASTDAQDLLAVVDFGDVGPDSVTITKSLITGLTPIPVSFQNIDTLDVTTTSGADSITVNMPAGASDLDVATVRGGKGRDNFDVLAVEGLTSLTLRGNGPFPYGNAPSAGDATPDFTGDLTKGDLFGATQPIRPSLTTIINVYGGDPTFPTRAPGDILGADTLVLDMSQTSATLATAVYVDTVAGVARSASHKVVNFEEIEDINLSDIDGDTNTQIGDLYIRASEAADRITLYPDNTYATLKKIRLRYNSTDMGPIDQLSGPNGTFSVPGKFVAYGRGGNDQITINNTLFKDTELFGQAGADYLVGSLGGGRDLLVGGIGADRLNGLTGDDILWGDQRPGAPESTEPTSLDGMDQLNGGAGNDRLDGGGASDRLYGEDGNDIVRGGDGDDGVVSGDRGFDIVIGGAGKDLVYGGTDRDIVIGGDGVDTVDGDGGEDIVIGDQTDWDDNTSFWLANNAPSQAYDVPTNDTALLQLLFGPVSGGDFWSSTNAYATRVASVALFNAIFSGVDDDGDIDTLVGDLDLDWYIDAFTVGQAATIDKYSGKLATEKLNDLP